MGSDNAAAGDSSLIELCIEAASQSPAAIDKWRRQRRSLDRLPTPLAEALLHRLFRRRLLQPSLLEIFKNSIECVDFSGENAVNSEWIAYLGAFRYLWSLNISDCHRITNSAIWPLAGISSLKEVDLSRCRKVSDTGIRYLLTVPTLEKLWISETGLTAEGMTYLSSLKNLSSLDLGGLPVTDQVLRSLQVLKKLQYLDLWGSKISDEGAVILKTFPKLVCINLAWTNITRLPSLPVVASLNMSNCSIQSLFEEGGNGSTLVKLIFAGATFSLSSEAFSYFDTSSVSYLDISSASLRDLSFLRHMGALTYLDLSFSIIEDNSIELIQSIGANLQSLNVSNTKITSTAVRLLAGHVPRLESISLASTQIEDDAIFYLSMMPLLKSTDLSNTCIKGYTCHAEAEPVCALSLTDLQNLKSLETLDLEGTQVLDDALLPLGGCKMLSRLSLRNASLTDVFLHHLSGLPRLTVIGFRDAVLTDNGLQAFTPPAALKSLDLRGCWLLTEDAILSFCQCFPHIEVRHELVHISPSNKGLTPTARTSLLKHKQERAAVALTRPVKESFIDQRLKYGRKELLALQSAGSSIELPANANSILNVFNNL